MATDKFPDVKEGTIKTGGKSGIISFVASTAIAMWAPVIITAPAVATRLPRVGTVAVTNSPLVVGVAVGGTGDVAGTGNAADAAGDVVDVAVLDPYSSGHGHQLDRVSFTGIVQHTIADHGVIGAPFDTYERHVPVRGTGD